MTMIGADGARLHVRVDGDAGAPAILLSNSLATDVTIWDLQVPLLTERFRVIRYDTRGHGRSDAPPGPYTFPMLVADALAVLDSQGVARATFMGISLGGMTGLGFALAHPERVERLVCCAARADAPDGFRKSWDERVAAVRRDGMAAVVPSTIERWLTPATRAAHPERTAVLEAMIRGTPVAGYVGCAAALKVLDYLKDLGRIAAPTLYVAGASDVATPPEAMRAMAAATPGADFASVAEAAHILNVDNPAGFDAAIAEFLGHRELRGG